MHILIYPLFYDKNIEKGVLVSWLIDQPFPLILSICFSIIVESNILRLRRLKFLPSHFDMFSFSYLCKLELIQIEKNIIITLNFGGRDSNLLFQSVITLLVVVTKFSKVLLLLGTIIFQYFSSSTIFSFILLVSWEIGFIMKNDIL